MLTKKLLRIKSGESILTYPHHKLKPLKKFYILISENYKKSNAYFGIEENISDQVLFYGFYAVCIFMLLFTYLITGTLYGF
ncbi:DUF3961 domain-containing protein [Bacillus sp. FSL K6-2944]|uniref:DUF3961 domain-containing protein n=1 Tax=Bacillus sp. FSL K6-2944 TaxID=2921486 RepID=UPI0030F75AFD